MSQWIKVSLLALAGGSIGFSTDFPLGTLLGSLFLIALVKIFSEKLPKIPLKGKRIIQMFIGGNIGLAFSDHTIRMLGEIWKPALIIAISHTLLALLTAFILCRFLKFDIITSISSSTPAGISEIVTIAERYNASITTVTILHLFRVIVIITFVPFFVIHIHFFN